MIRINLLGDDTAIDNSWKFLLAGYAAAAVLCVGVFFHLYNDVGSEIEDLAFKSETLTAQLATLKEKTKAVRELEVKKDLVQKKLAIIAKLKKSKTGPVRVLDDLNRSVPARVWLRRIIEDGDRMEIKGRAMSNQDIALFMKNLEGSEYYTAVELRESRQMYYSKRTGQVSPTPDIQQIRSDSPDFGEESRVSKEVALKQETIIQGDWSKKWGPQSEKRWRVKPQSYRDDSPGRNRMVDDWNVKIKEFIIDAHVLYAGKLSLLDLEQPASGLHQVKMRKRK